MLVTSLLMILYPLLTYGKVFYSLLTKKDRQPRNYLEEKGIADCQIFTVDFFVESYYKSYTVRVTYCEMLLCMMFVYHR